MTNKPERPPSGSTERPRYDAAPYELPAASRHVRSRSVVAEDSQRYLVPLLPSFPMQQHALTPFVHACQSLSSSGRNWNEAFQEAWDMPCSTRAMAEDRFRALHALEAALFDASAATVVQIVEMHEGGPDALPNSQHCHRVDNVFFRVLPDHRSGRNYLTALRSILLADTQSWEPRCRVPMSIMVTFKGIPVLVQSLVPLRGVGEQDDGSMPKAALRGLHEILCLPTTVSLADELTVHPAADERWYVISAPAVVRPVFDDDTIVARHEIVAPCLEPIVKAAAPSVVARIPDAVELMLWYINSTTAAKDTTSSPEAAATLNAADLHQLVVAMHETGVNLCFLRLVAEHVVANAQSAPPRQASTLLMYLAIEMIARTTKYQFYLEAQGRNEAYDEDGVKRSLSKHIGNALDLSTLWPLLKAKYGIPIPSNATAHSVRLSSSSETSTGPHVKLVTAITKAVAQHHTIVVERVRTLLGATLEVEAAATVVQQATAPSALHMRGISASRPPPPVQVHVSWSVQFEGSVLPITCEPQRAHDLWTSIKRQDEVALLRCPKHHLFFLPLQCRVGMWTDNYAEARVAAEAVALYAKNAHGTESAEFLFSCRTLCDVSLHTNTEAAVVEGKRGSKVVINGLAKHHAARPGGLSTTETVMGMWHVDAAKRLVHPNDAAQRESCIREAVGCFERSARRQAAASGFPMNPHVTPALLKPYHGYLAAYDLQPNSVDLRSHVETLLRICDASWPNAEAIQLLWQYGLTLEDLQAFDDAARLLLTAVLMAKRLHPKFADLATLLLDTAHVYRQWSLKGHTDKVEKLLLEACDCAASTNGIESMEHGIAKNNLGAVQIELERLQYAEGALDDAGRVFAAAQCPHDDPEFLVYLHNCEHLTKQRKTVERRRGMSQQLPFVAAPDGIPLEALELESDPMLAELMEQRAACAKASRAENDLEARIRAHIAERAAVKDRATEDLLRQFPFLSARVHGVALDELLLPFDPRFNELSTKYFEAKQSSDANALPGAEYLLQAHVGKRGRDLAARKSWRSRVEHALTEQLSTETIKQLPLLQAPLASVAEYRPFVECLVAPHTQPRLVEVLTAYAAASTHAQRGALDLIDGHPAYASLAPYTTASRTRSLIAPMDPAPPHCTAVTRPKYKGHHEQRYRQYVWDHFLRGMQADADAEDFQSYAHLFPVFHGHGLRSVDLIIADHDAMQDLHSWAALEEMAPTAERREQASALAARLHTFVKRRGDAIAAASKDAHFPYRINNPTSVDGVPPDVVNYDEDADALASDPFLRQTRVLLRTVVRDGTVRHGTIAATEQLRLKQLAGDRAKASDVAVRERDAVEGRYPFLDKRPEGIPLATLHVDDDAAFHKLANDRALLLRNAGRHGSAIAEREAQMNERAHELARERKGEDTTLRGMFPFLDPRPEGVPLCEVGLLEDAAFAELASELAAAQGGRAQAGVVAELERRMNELAHKLAKDEKHHVRQRAVRAADLRQRFPWLPDEPATGVALVDAKPLMSPELRAAMNRIDDLLGAPEANTASIARLERETQAMVEKLADGRRAACRDATAAYPMLEARTLGVALSDLPLRTDGEFCDLAAKHEELSQDPTRNAAALDELEAKLEERARELAQTAKAIEGHRHDADESVRARNPFLQRHERKCVPLRLIPLSADTEYQEGAAARLGLLQSPEENAAAIAEAEGALASRADALARDVAKAEQRLLDRYPFVDPHPAGLWLVQLDPEQDAAFAALAAQHAEQMKDPVRNANNLAAIEARMNDRVHELAGEARKEEQRAAEAQDALRTAYPMLGRPIDPAVANDDEFQALAAQRAALLKDHEHSNAAAVEEIEGAMRDRAASLGALRSIPVKEPSAIAAKYPFLLTLGEALGVDLDGLWLEDDAYFRELAVSRESLIAGGDENAPLVRCLEDQMRTRVEQLAGDRAKASDVAVRERDAVEGRYPFLDKRPEGIPLATLHVDDDAAFHKLANDRALLLRNAGRHGSAIAEREAQMNERAHELARERKGEDTTLRGMFPFLDPRPEGVPLCEVGLLEDAAFAELASELAAAQGGRAQAGVVAELERRMNELAHKLAKDEKHHVRQRAVRAADLRQRFPWLPDEPATGVALVDAKPLMSPELRAAMNRIDDLLGAPEANTASIARLERETQAMVEKLADGRRAACRDATAAYPMLEARTLGVALSDLPLRTDGEFCDLAAKHEELSQDPTRNAAALDELEAKLEERARELAQTAKAIEGHRHDADESVRARNPFLQRHERKCVPLRLIPLSADTEYQEGAAARLGLLQSPEENAAAIAEAEGALASRADALARDVAKAEQRLLDRYPFVDPHPAGLWLVQLDPEQDAAFAALAAQHAEQMKDPVRNANNLAAIEARMNDRVHELAGEARKEEQRAAEAQDALRTAYPMLGRPVDPAVAHDAEFKAAAAKLPAGVQWPSEAACLADGLALSLRSFEALVELRQTPFVDPCMVGLEREMDRLLSLNARDRRGSAEGTVGGVSSSVSGAIAALQRQMASRRTRWLQRLNDALHAWSMEARTLTMSMHADARFPFGVTEGEHHASYFDCEWDGACKHLLGPHGSMQRGKDAFLQHTSAVGVQARRLVAEFPEAPRALLFAVAPWHSVLRRLAATEGVVLAAHRIRSTIVRRASIRGQLYRTLRCNGALDAGVVLAVGACAMHELVDIHPIFTGDDDAVAAPRTSEGWAAVAQRILQRANDLAAKPEDATTAMDATVSSAPTSAAANTSQWCAVVGDWESDAVEGTLAFLPAVLSATPLRFLDLEYTAETRLLIDERRRLLASTAPKDLLRGLEMERSIARAAAAVAFDRTQTESGDYERCRLSMPPDVYTRAMRVAGALPVSDVCRAAKDGVATATPDAMRRASIDVAVEHSDHWFHHPDRAFKAPRVVRPLLQRTAVGYLVRHRMSHLRGASMAERARRSAAEKQQLDRALSIKRAQEVAVGVLARTGRGLQARRAVSALREAAALQAIRRVLVGYRARRNMRRALLTHNKRRLQAVCVLQRAGRAYCRRRAMGQDHAAGKQLMAVQSAHARASALLQRAGRAYCRRRALGQDHAAGQQLMAVQSAHARASALLQRVGHGWRMRRQLATERHRTMLAKQEQDRQNVAQRLLARVGRGHRSRMRLALAEPLEVKRRQALQQLLARMGRGYLCRADMSEELAVRRRKATRDNAAKFLRRIMAGFAARTRIQKKRRIAAKQRQEALRLRAAKLLRNVMDGYAMRKKLCVRRYHRQLQHRRAMLANLSTLEAQKRAEIAAFERAQARALVNAHLAVKEHVRRNADERMGVEHLNRLKKQKVREMEAEEAKRRRKIAEDEIMAHQTMHAAMRSRPAVVRPPTRPQAPRTGQYQGGPRVDPAATLNVVARELISQDSISQYKGFPLDTMGRFLLKYERDLKRMKADLEAHRTSLQFDHDIVRDARDQAASEISMSLGSGMRGTGATAWIPSRPLPLKDLVKDGPSAAVHQRKKHAATPGTRSAASTPSAAAQMPLS